MLKKLSYLTVSFMMTASFAFAGGKEISGADTSWMLLSTALVLLMTPALAFFYGGLVRSKNVLNTMSMSFVSMGFVGIAWLLFGYTMSFSSGNLFLGDFRFAFMNNVAFDADTTGLSVSSITIPHILFMVYQGTFAIITAALISGAVVERMRFSAYLLFITLWSLLVYAPMAHWVWGGGFLAKLGDLMGGSSAGLFALDFAGGTVVHINAAAAAVVAAIMIGKRKDYTRQAILPHNVPFVLLGAALLWFGWFGFNAGSAWASGTLASLAFVNTAVAPMATLVVWNLLDLFKGGKITAVGIATAIVVGLVAITPAAGFVSPMSALIIGGISALPCYFGIQWRSKTRLDDSLDVFAAHGLGGITGALLTGVFAQKALNSAGGDGLLFGNPMQFVIQLIAILVAIVFSVVMTFLILKLVSFITPLRATSKEEGLGMDIPLHGEEAYTDGEGAILMLDDELKPVSFAVKAENLAPALS